MNPIPEAAEPHRERPGKFRRALPWLVFLAALAVFLLQRCPSDPPPGPAQDTGSVVSPAPETAAMEPEIRPRPPKRVPGTSEFQESAAGAAPIFPDSLPYVFADPWGGRHFDSVIVRLHCVEDCAILYSLEDSVNLMSYEGQFIFRRNTALWFAGVDSAGRRTDPVRLEYVIEKNRGTCAAGSMPIGPREVCMDIYEWPNREGAQPRTMVGWAEAGDSCRAVGKRLCALEEWREACRGPELSPYPYGSRYDARYCASRQAEASRSGRTVACRSYYGIYDLAGNVWEWTRTPDPGHEDFFFVAGGNWEAAEKADCGLAKYSFYPQNRYPGVGFRCCAEAK